MRLFHKLPAWLRKRVGNTLSSESWDVTHNSASDQDVSFYAPGFAKTKSRSELHEPLITQIQQTVTSDRSQVIGQVSGSSTAIGYVEKFYGVSPFKATVPFQMPSLPTYFVKRSEHHRAVKAILLLSKDNHTPETLVISAIYGLGGIGKSTLAAALAHDAEIQDHFQDGVLWATLGQTPDILSWLSNWIQALGDYAYTPKTLDAASMHLQTLLRGKKVFLVVDDVWEAEHVEPFRVGGNDCKLLVTTREARIPDVTPYDLDVMTPEESLQLLTNLISKSPQGNRFTSTELQQAQMMAGEVGYLPLAIELAVAQVVNGVTWQELLAEFQQEIVRLEALDLPGVEVNSNESKRKKRSLVASFNLSLRRLPLEQYRMFALLGVLPEDVLITQTMAATLWDVSSPQANDVLHSLKARAILVTRATHDQPPTYRIHDLLHDRARNLLTSPSEPSNQEQLVGLGLTLPEAHVAFLNRYRLCTESGLWHTLPDDGYIHANLAWHFERAGLVDELHKLLREEAADGRNGWYQAREKLGQIAGYLADVNRAWILAEKEAVFVKNSSMAISLQCRYGLVIASLNSLIGNIPAALVATLVEKTLWEPEKGLAYSAYVRQPLEKVNLLMQLLPYLPKPLEKQAFQEALKTLHTIDDKREQVETLIHLLPQASKVFQQQILQEILRTVQSLENWHESFQARVLIGLVEYLPHSLMQETVEIVQTFQDERMQAKVLKELLPHLPRPLMQKVWRIILLSEGRESWFSTLDSMASSLHESLKGQLVQNALTAAQIFKNGKKISASAIVNRMEQRTLQRALTPFHMIDDVSNAAEVLAILLPHLTESLRRQIARKVLAIVHLVESKSIQVEILSRIAPHLTKPLRRKIVEKVLAKAHLIDSESIRAEVLSRVAPYVPRWSLRKVWKEIQKFPDQDDRIKILKALLQQEIPQVWKKNFLQEILVAIQALADLNVIPEAVTSSLIEIKTNQTLSNLSVLAPYLSEVMGEKMLQDVLAVAQSIRNEIVRAKIFPALAPYLTGSLQGRLMWKALAVAQGIEYELDRAKALIALVPNLPEPTKGQVTQETLEIIQRLKNAQDRAETLLAFVSSLPQTQKNRTLQAALENIQAIKDERKRAALLKKMVLYLLEPLQQKILIAAQEIEDVKIRGNLFIDLMPYLLTSLLGEALIAVQKFEDEEVKLEVLTCLVPYLSQELSDKAITAAHSLNEPEYRALMLIRLTPNLSKSLQRQSLQDALNIAQHLRHKNAQLEALTKLATLQPYSLPGKEFQVILEMVQGIAYGRIQVWGLNKLVQVVEGLPNWLRWLALQWVLSFLKGIDLVISWVLELVAFGSSWLRNLQKLARKTSWVVAQKGLPAWVLCQVVPYLPAAFKEQSLQKSLTLLPTIENANFRSEALVSLTPHLPESPQSKVLKSIQSIENANLRSEALVSLTPHLPESIQQEVLTTVLAIESSSLRVETLVALTPHLPESIKQRALQETVLTLRAITDQRLRAITLSKVTQYLPDALKEITLREALIDILKIKRSSVERAGFSVYSQTEVLTFLAPHLAKHLLQEAMIEAQSIRDADIQTVALARLAIQLPESMKKQVLQKALKTTRTIKDKSLQVKTLIALTHYISKPLKEQVKKEILVTIGTIENQSDRTVSLSLLLPYLPKILRMQALSKILKLVQIIENESDRVEMLTNLAPYLQELWFYKASMIGRQSSKDEDSLEELLNELIPEIRDQEEQELPILARAIWEESRRGQVLALFIRELPRPLLREILKGAWENENRSTLIQALPQLILCLIELLSEKTLENLLSVVQTIRNENDRLKVLTALAPCLSELNKESILHGEFLVACRSATSTTENTLSQARLLSKLLAYLPPLKRQQELQSMLLLVDMIKDKRSRSEALNALALHLPNIFLPEGLGVEYLFTNKIGQLNFLTLRMQNLPNPLLEQVQCGKMTAAQVIQELLKKTRTTQLIKNDVVKARVLTLVVQHLPYVLTEWARQEALIAARKIQDKSDYAEILSNLVPHLPETSKKQVVQEAIIAAREIEDKGNQVQVLSNLAAHLHETLLEEILLEAVQMNEEIRTSILERLVPCLSRFPPEKLYSLWCTVLHTLALRSRGDFLRDICAFTPVISILGGTEAVVETTLAVQDVGQWWK